MIVDDTIGMHVPSYADTWERLVAPVAVIPERAVADVTPVQRFLIGFIVAAFNDAEGRWMGRVGRLPVMARAQWWWLDDTSTDVGSLRWACAGLGVDPGPLRHRLAVQWAEAGMLMPMAARCRAALAGPHARLTRLRLPNVTVAPREVIRRRERNRTYRRLEILDLPLAAPVLTWDAIVRVDYLGAAAEAA